jgi:hypothetical protein
MILIKQLGLKRFRNLKNAELNGLRDLNILIGPNNCGKTNILEAIQLISQLAHGPGYNYLCQDCLRSGTEFQGTHEGGLEGVYVALATGDYYLKKPPRNEEVELSLLLDRQSVEKLVPRVLGKQQESIKIACSKAEDKITLRNMDSGLFAVHFSPFLHRDILDEIKRVLYCPEERLQQYKDKTFVDFLRDKSLSGGQMRRLIDLLARVVDPRIQDYKSQDLIQILNQTSLTVTIAEQGSGVRSLVCLAADILADESSRIVLLDEPELGLNPAARQEFLKFLVDVSKDRQLFVATQDPCFVNPALWRDQKDKVSVQLFSIQTDSFVSIDLHQNQEDPSVFAGYLPHTTSLREVHIYVEGSSDVYILQVWLRKFLQQVEEHDASAVEISPSGASMMVKHARYELGDRFEIQNKIAVFHLCGNFWSHLLYTIPKNPYRCVVILDGNKKGEVPVVLKKHNASETNTSKFELVDSVQELANAIKVGLRHPIYCLKKNNIEDYLFPGERPTQYNKRVDGPRAAERLERLPEEAFDLFLAILKPSRTLGEMFVTKPTGGSI